MDKQSTIAFILIGIILVFWLYLNSPDPSTLPPQTQDSTVVTNEPTKNLETSEKKIAEESAKPLTNFKTEEETVSNLPEKILTVETDLALIELTSRGARIKKFYLKKYKSWYYAELEDTTNFYNSHVQLINTSKEGGDFNVVYVTKDGQLVNTKSLDFKLDNSKSHIKVDANDSLMLSYTYDAGDGRSLSKEFVFYGMLFA